MIEDADIREENLTGEQKREREKTQLHKAKRNLVYVSMVSVVMLFGGLVSAYIVSMGDSFWLKTPMPIAFWISTAVIGLSSITFMASLRAARKNQLGALKLLVALTFLLGLTFVYFQFKGYGQLIDQGVHAASNHIVVTDGKYGDYFEVKYKGDYIEVNGNDYLLKGKKMTEAQISAYQKFMAQFLELDKNQEVTVKEYGKEFVILFHSEALQVKEQHFITANGETLSLLDNARLRDLAVHVRDRRGDFFVKGEMGKDFHIYYKGQELIYKDRELYKDGRPLDNYLQLKSMETPDTASSYLYIITFLHLLHIIITLLVMIRPLIHSFTGKINKDNTIGLETAGIFWHFLGLLWLGLLLFLLFIH